MDMEVLVEWVGKLLGRMFGTQNERAVRRYWTLVREQINPLEPKMMALPDSAFPKLSDEFRARLGTGATLDSILPEAFAACREASRRAAKMRHFDVQLIGGAVLHEGKISEMATGEGKTLVATLPAYLNSLTGKGVHLVTVNDYLARRDTQWMGPIYDLLGVSVGTIQHDESFRFDRAYSESTADRMHNLRPVTRQDAYRCDITYGTNNEFGFDYLRDNMKFRQEDQVQHGRHAYAIVDEVDSILIDEARTPLIISGPTEESTTKYYDADRCARKLTKGEEIVLEDRTKKHTGDFIVKEKEHIVFLTDNGIEKAEKLIGVGSFYTGENMEWPHFIETALKAHHLYKKDQEYVSKDGEVIIVDEFTGRMMPGRRWSDGLHQAVEAKEGLKIQEESQTYATITLQHYFKLYSKLAGMTGTALTEAMEFEKIYGLEVTQIPTNRPLRRQNLPDVVYGTDGEKYDAIEEEIVRLHATGRPILVGTTSIEKSELLHERLKMRGIIHEVLNAKHHERESNIIARAGQKDAVTIATNMAGRGTDILLGDAVADLGGLHILGTERHEARRVDNQLRGRAGRQGDPGSSQFFLSLEDDLFRKFAPPWMKGVLQKMGLKEGERIESGLVSRSIGKAQKNVENHNFDIRKNLVEYDQVRSEQRRVIYSLRQRVLDGEDMKKNVMEMVERRIGHAVDKFLPKGEDANVTGLGDWFKSRFGVDASLEGAFGKDPVVVADELVEQAAKAYADRERVLGLSEARGAVAALARRYMPEHGELVKNFAEFARQVKDRMGVTVPESLVRLPQAEMIDGVTELVGNEKRQDLGRRGADSMRALERFVLLNKIDEKWKDMLYNMDQLRDIVGMRSFAQQDPKLEFKRDATELFQTMMEAIDEDVTTLVFRMSEVPEDEARLARRWQAAEYRKDEVGQFAMAGGEGSGNGNGSGGNGEEEKPQPVRVEKKPGRNEPCWCSSGKKYKKCHWPN
ncbi:MAG TPA: preprotein translocase subunit SecA [Planctomycetota bacterium]|nr:preprotein translocase subunit SecA [Planctomycetota bacterium]